MAWPLILSSVVEVVEGHYGAHDDSEADVDDHASLEEGRDDGDATNLEGKTCEEGRRKLNNPKIQFEMLFNSKKFC